MSDDNGQYYLRSGKKRKTESDSSAFSSPIGISPLFLRSPTSQLCNTWDEFYKITKLSFSDYTLTLNKVPEFQITLDGPSDSSNVDKVVGNIIDADIKLLLPDCQETGRFIVTRILIELLKAENMNEYMVAHEFTGFHSTGDVSVISAKIIPSPTVVIVDTKKDFCLTPSMIIQSIKEVQLITNIQAQKEALMVLTIGAGGRFLFFQWEQGINENNNFLPSKFNEYWPFRIPFNSAIVCKIEELKKTVKLFLSH